MSKKKEAAANPNPCSRRWAFTLYPECLRAETNLVLKKQIPIDVPLKADDISVEGVMCYMMEQLPTLRGLLLSLEEGDSKQHLHLQGYAEFSKPIRFSGIQGAIKGGIHLETARGDREENFAYCLHTGVHKDKGILHESKIMGNWPNVSGNERNMYDEAVAMILEGQSILSVSRAYKGAILPMLSNLSRLAAEVSKYQELDLAYLRKQEKERDDWQRWEKDNDEIPF